MKTETKKELTLEDLRTMRTDWIKEALHKSVFSNLKAIAVNLGEPIEGIKHTGWVGYRFVETDKPEIVVEVYRGDIGYDPKSNGDIVVTNFSVYVGGPETIAVCFSKIPGVRDPFGPGQLYVPGDWEARILQHLPKAMALQEKALNEVSEAEKRTLLSMLLIGKQI